MSQNNKNSLERRKFFLFNMQGAAEDVCNSGIDHSERIEYLFKKQSILPASEWRKQRVRRSALMFSAGMDKLRPGAIRSPVKLINLKKWH